MKKILFASLLCIGLAASAQQPISNLYLQPGSTPTYANGSNTGSGLTWGYKEYATLPTTHDTLRLITTTTYAKIVFDSVQGETATPLVILGDTTGDTASFSKYPAKATTWYKKNPFLLNHQCDEVTFTFNGSKAHYTTVKFGANFMVRNVWAHDTVMITKIGTNTGGLQVTFTYSYQRAAWVLKNYASW